MQPRIAALVLFCSLTPAWAFAQVNSWRPTASSATAANTINNQNNGNSSRVITAAANANVAQPRTSTNFAAQSPVTQSPVTPTAPAARNATGQRITRAPVTKGSSKLPNDHGQVWREYDISSYTLRSKGDLQPEQRIVDWILRETGYEAWHSTPVGLLSADSRTLRVYHTPQMQAIVADIADRFVNQAAENQGFGMRVITIKNPNWRTRALPLMTSLPAQSPGVQAWMLAKEDAALLMSELRRRTDYTEHNPPHQIVRNGQALSLSSMRNRTYTKGIIRTQQTWPGYQPEIGQLSEGFSLEFSPLLSMDTRTVDAVIKLRLSQVEKMLSVKLEVPNNIAPNQRAECHVPQMTTVQLHERFRWPADKVLLLSMGVVATPGPKKPNLLTDALPFAKSAPRADALLFIESKGLLAPTTPTGSTGPSTAGRLDHTFHGRY